MYLKSSRSLTFSLVVSLSTFAFACGDQTDKSQVMSSPPLPTTESLASSDFLYNYQLMAITSAHNIKKLRFNKTSITYAGGGNGYDRQTVFVDVPESSETPNKISIPDTDYFITEVLEKSIIVKGLNNVDLELIMLNPVPITKKQYQISSLDWHSLRSALLDSMDSLAPTLSAIIPEHNSTLMKYDIRKGDTIIKVSTEALIVGIHPEKIKLHERGTIEMTIHHRGVPRVIVSLTVGSKM